MQSKTLNGSEFLKLMLLYKELPQLLWRPTWLQLL